MDTVNYLVYLILLVAMLGGVVVWAFGRQTQEAL